MPADANLLYARRPTSFLHPADLGLARIYQAPLQPLVLADRVVVTIWYRAPELLLGAKHYTKTIGKMSPCRLEPDAQSLNCTLPPRSVTMTVDLWSIGCIFAELLLLHSPFKGKEVKAQANNRNPFQRNQLEKIFEYLGLPGRTARDATRPHYAYCLQVLLKSRWARCVRRRCRGPVERRQGPARVWPAQFVQQKVRAKRAVPP